MLIAAMDMVKPKGMHMIGPDAGIEVIPETLGRASLGGDNEERSP